MAIECLACTWQAPTRQPFVFEYCCLCFGISEAVYTISPDSGLPEGIRRSGRVIAVSATGYCMAELKDPR